METESEMPTEPFRIMVVDDDPDLKPLIRQAMRPEIRSGRYIFSFAGNGAEALDLLDQGTETDMVMSDINMPRMDGLTLLDHISKRDSDIRSIIVSAYGDMKNIRTAMNRGAFDFITKPLDLDDLRITIERTRNHLIEWRRATGARDRLVEIQHELDIASRMQQAILPKIFPKKRGYEIHGSMTPAQNVGGDFFEVITLANGQVGLAVADVSGKGVPAALFMMSSRTLLKGSAIGLGNPGQVLAEVNSTIHQENENTMFVTMLYAVYNPETTRLTYSNGGHRNPMMINPQGECSELPTTRGVALGLVPRINYQEGSVMLEPNSTIILYTDGVSEAMNSASEEFGTERIMEIFQGKPPENAEEAAERIISRVREFAGDIPQSDDVTCLVLHRTEGGE